MNQKEHVRQVVLFMSVHDFMAETEMLAYIVVILLNRKPTERAGVVRF